MHAPLPTRRQFLGLTSSALLAGCATTSGQQSMGEYLEDSAVTLRVRQRLVNEPALGTLNVDVDTLAGTVVLKGDARSTAQRQLAESLARAVAGVKAVRNQIVVRP